MDITGDSNHSTYGTLPERHWDLHSPSFCAHPFLANLRKAHCHLILTSLPIYLYITLHAGWTSLLNHTFHILGIILIDLICMYMSVLCKFSMNIHCPYPCIFASFTHIPLYSTITFDTLYIYIESTSFYIPYDKFLVDPRWYFWIIVIFSIQIPDSIQIPYGFPMAFCDSGLLLSSQDPCADPWYLCGWSTDLAPWRSPKARCRGSPEELVSWKSQSEMDDD